MAVQQERIQLKTDGHTDVIDITDQVKRKLDRTGISDGIVCVFIPGSTGALTTIEYEPGCIKDLKELVEVLVPSNGDYHHEANLENSNAHSHMRASLLGPSVSLPVDEGQLLHGRWQSVIFVDFDNKKRERNLVVQIVGE